MKSKRTIAIIIVVLLVIILIVIKKSQNRHKELDENSKTETVDTSNYYYDEYGNQYLKGNIEMTYEDVIYTYVKSLALLDFSSALSYVNHRSTVVEGYEVLNFDSRNNNNYSASIRSKMYKKVVTSLIIEKIVDTVILPDKYVVTLDITHLDLNGKDFWLEDKEELFEEMKLLKNDISSVDINSKTYRYLSDYVSTFFDREDAPTTVSQIEITVERNAYGSWLISNDSDLLLLCNSNDGTYLVLVITEAFNEWYSEYLKSRN